MLDTNGVLWAIASGAGMGLLLALFGYLKGLTNPEEFDPVKFLTTIGIGAVVGGIAAAANISYDQALVYAATLGLTTMIEMGAKALVRYLRARWAGKDVVIAPTSPRGPFPTDAELAKLREKAEKIAAERKKGGI